MPCCLNINLATVMKDRKTSFCIFLLMMTPNQHMTYMKTLKKHVTLLVS